MEHTAAARQWLVAGLCGETEAVEHEQLSPDHRLYGDGVGADGEVGGMGVHVRRPSRAQATRALARWG